MYRVYKHSCDDKEIIIETDHVQHVKCESCGESILDENDFTEPIKKIINKAIVNSVAKEAGII
jgi:hypothetical protein